VSLAFREFPTLPADVDIATRLSVKTMPWDYFPHRARGGKCPTELLAELQNKSPPIASSAKILLVDNAGGWDGVD
jgi:hypothetical protein